MAGETLERLKRYVPIGTDRPTDAGTGLIEPTEDERRNGWTAETLTRYFAERQAEQAAHYDNPRRRNGGRPSRANRGSYKPAEWWKG